MKPSPVAAYRCAANSADQVVLAGEPRELLRRVVTAAVGVQGHLIGELSAHPHRHRQRGLDQIGVQVLADCPADHPP